MSRPIHKHFIEHWAKLGAITWLSITLFYCISLFINAVWAPQVVNAQEQKPVVEENKVVVIGNDQGIQELVEEDENFTYTSITPSAKKNEFQPKNASGEDVFEIEIK